MRGAELREWTAAGGWRCLFRAPGELSAVALAEDGALWLAGEHAVYRHQPEARVRAAQDALIGRSSVPVALDDVPTLRYEEARAC